MVYGRRRIGKTELIRKALEDRHAFHFEGLENRPRSEQIQAFLLQLEVQTGTRVSGKRGIRSWREALLELKPHLERRPGGVVLDEFQWMANYRTAIVADLKMVWDQYLGRIDGVDLILCGSIASFMTTQVIRSSALYGRTELALQLGGFKLRDTARMLPDLGLDELLEAQMLVGGVPKYLDLVRGYPSILFAIDDLAFTAGGYFVEEYDRVFVSHFGRNRAYSRIVDALAAHPYGLRRNQIADEAQVPRGGRLSVHLQDLGSAGFVTSIRPVDKGPKSKLVKYVLSDAYLRFYTTFIRDRLADIAAGRSRLFAGISQTGRYQDWRGRAFEQVCLDHSLRIAEILGFSGIDYSVGPFFRSARLDRPGTQIDLLYDRADNVLTVCEIKSSRQPTGRSVEDEVERKVQALAAAHPRRTIQRVLIVHGDVSRHLLDSSYFYRIVRSDELLG